MSLCMRSNCRFQLQLAARRGHVIGRSDQFPDSCGRIRRKKELGVNRLALGKAVLFIDGSVVVSPQGHAVLGSE